VTPASDESEITEIASELRDYLERNQEAADTLPGIVRWWWQLQRYRSIASKVERALKRLEAEGVVGTRTLPSGETLYFLKRASRGQ
jgi:hypothetical protein